MVSQFSCGHVGRNSDSYRAKAEAFIRVAEIRREQVEVENKPCPDCKGR